MQPVLSVENMRRSDAYTCSNITPSRELMYAAGKAIFEATDWRPPVAIVCGSGNNAGDGYVAALLMSEAGIDCRLILLKEKFSADGEYYFGKCLEAGIKHELFSSSTDLSHYGSVLDCIFGTGFKGNADGSAANLIEAINCSGAYIVSADINSGLNGDTGLGIPAVHADLTVSIGGYKPGHFLGTGKDCIKRLINADIGIHPLERCFFLLDDYDAAAVLKPRPNFSNKGDYGYIALIGGSLRYSGAIRLANIANSAMRAGAGVVKLAVPKSICLGIMPHILESTLFPLDDCDGQFVFSEPQFAELLRGVKTAAFGMGIGISRETEKALDYLLANFCGTLVIDADGLNALSHISADRIKNAHCQLVLTPHLKEFSHLCGKSIDEINNAPIKTAETYASEIGAVVLLKGPTTIITDGRVTYLCPRGCPGMATAGSGDVLSGIMAAICASCNDDITAAAAAAAYINGLAGELAQEECGAVSMIAGDTTLKVRNAIKQLKNK